MVEEPRRVRLITLSLLNLLVYSNLFDLGIFRPWAQGNLFREGQHQWDRLGNEGREDDAEDREKTLKTNSSI